MRIGLIDVDGHNFPNLPLMKLSAWHKAQGDSVEWYDAMFSDPLDICYMSKVFSFTDDYMYPIRADKIIKGGSGYCIDLEDGRERFCKQRDEHLPYEIEHIYPDYSIYPQFEDTAYGFLTRGCPRGCGFCIVGEKEGRKAYKVADLDEFWRGQSNIVLCDPNITACREWKDLFQQLIDSKASIEFSQGLDIRMMTDEKAEMLKQMKVKKIHFAWDKYEDGRIVIPKLERFKEVTHWWRDKVTVYVLCNFDTTLEQDLERIYTVRDMGFSPYVMLYNKDSLPKGHEMRRLQRYVNNRLVFNSCQNFEEYQRR